MSLTSAAVEHRPFRTLITVTEKAARSCPATELRRIVRGLVVSAVVAQTDIGWEEAKRLVREGVIRVEPVSQTGLSWSAAGEVAVRLDN